MGNSLPFKKNKASGIKFYIMAKQVTYKSIRINDSQPLVKGITVQNNTKYTVATPKLNVRSNASTSSALLGSLQNGTQLQVVETVGTWYKIRFGTGYGYVAKHYVGKIKRNHKLKQLNLLPFQQFSNSLLKEELAQPLICAGNKCIMV